MADIDDELIRHHRAAFGWALACCRWDPSAAEDVLQNAYLKLISGRANVPAGVEVRAFLFSVVRLTAKEERRRRAVRATLSLSALFGQAAAANPPVELGPMIRDETARQLLAALDRLTPRQHDVLHLVFYQNLTIEGASVVLGISVGSARTHYERGKARLRELLGDELEHA